jgi:putative ABC transport system permease protein
MGVRLALGARPGQLRALMLREALVTAAAGTVMRLAGAVAVSRSLRALLFEVSPIDPVALASACGVLLAAAVVAAWLPARRATAVDPVAALYSE